MSYVKDEFKDKIQDDVVGQPGDSEFEAKLLLFEWLNSSQHNQFTGPYYGHGWPSFCNNPITEWDEVFRKYFTEDGLRAAKIVYEQFVRKNLIGWMLHMKEKKLQENYGPSRGWPSFCNQPIEEWDDWLMMKRFKEDSLRAAKAAYDKYRSLTGGKRRKRTKFNKRKSSSRVLSKSRRRTHRK
jgi:hypothetical protein